MKKVNFIYTLFYDFEKKRTTIGGIQTYILNLKKIFEELGYECVLYQIGNRTEETTIDDMLIKSVSVPGKKNTTKVMNKIINLISGDINNDEDIVVFMTDTLIEKNNFKNSIAIQHGVFWDIPTNDSRGCIRMLLSRAKRAYFNIKKLKYVKSVVCVDYNFVNWLRTQINYELSNFTVIPNFTEISQKNVKNNECVNIIFARRLFEYRGTKIFTKAIKRLLDENYNIKVTIAGTGEDEEWMKNELKDYENVLFTTYVSSESLIIHSDKDIAVVPTVGSEGTSLSLLEAMSSQCAVICTNVGGMTNIVIDGYNGLIISPNSNEIYFAMKKLVEDKELRNDLAKKGYETVKCGFSLEKWKEKWINVIEGL